jgi:hypothetical protein
VSYNSSNFVVTLTPSASLANSTTYTATISGAEDTAGDSMAGPVTWSFTTGALTVGAPTVIGESPAPNATGVAVTCALSAILPLTVSFNQAVQPGTINFTLANSSGTQVASTVWYSDATDTATLTPEGILANSTTYTATVSGAQSASGVAMSAPVSWSFTTAAKVTMPAVLSTSPAFNATSVDVGTPIAVNFNEAILASSVSSANFTLKGASGTMIPASVSYRDIGALHTATLTPSAALAYSTTYTVTISGVKDAAGNILASPYTWSFVTASGSQTNTQLPLVYQSNFQYLGGFRVPSSDPIGASQFNYAGDGLAFNPANNSLFIGGNVHDDSVAEIAIPSSIVNSSNLNNLATASVLQPFIQTWPIIPNTSNLGDGTWATKGPVDLGGLMVVNGQLLGTLYVYYDNSGTTVVTHFRLDSLNLSSPRAEGMFQVGTSGLGGGLYDGYMGAIPSSWQSALGAPDLTGQCCINIVSRTSYGPAVFGFDPSTLNTSTPSTATPYVYYTATNPLEGQWNTTDPLWNGNAAVSGVFFVPGTRSVLFFGSMGTNRFYYGDAGAANDPYRGGKGDHSINGDYAYQVWAYDANDFLAVKNGQMQTWQLQPYAVWNLDFPQFDGAKYLGGVAFDPATSRLYVTELGGDSQVQYTYVPVVQVFQLTLSPPGGNGATGAVVQQLNNPTTTMAITPPADTASDLSAGRTVLSAADAATITGSTHPQNTLLGNIPDLRVPHQGKKQGSAPQSVFSRTDTLLRLANRIHDRVRAGNGLGLTSIKPFGSEIE